MCILFVCLYVQMEKTNTTASNFQTINSQSIGCEMKLPISLTSTNRTKTKMKNWSNDLQPNSIFLGTQSIAASKFGWGTERRQISSVCCLCSFYWREHSSRSRRQHCSNRNSNNKTPPPDCISIFSFHSFLGLLLLFTFTFYNVHTPKRPIIISIDETIRPTRCWDEHLRFMIYDHEIYWTESVHVAMAETENQTSSYSDWKPLDHD